MLCFTLVLPWAAGAILALHHGHSAHHQEPSVHDAEALDLIVHGHHHEPGAPAHQHHIVIAKQSPWTTKPSPVLLPAAHRPCGPGLPSLAAGARIVHPDSAHAPPPGTKASPVLRI